MLLSQIREIPQIFAHRNEFFQQIHALKLDSILYKHAWGDRQYPKSLLEELQIGDKLLVDGPTIRCKQEYMETASLQLKENLKFASLLVQKVQEMVPHSPNYTSRTYRTQPVLQKHEEGMLTQAENMLTQASWIKSPFERAEEIKKIGFGFCEDMALVGCIYAQQNHDKNVERCGVAGSGAHHFLVIGRAKDSDPNDYKTWGELCVVSDPWAGLCYPISMVEKELYVYTKSIRMNFFNCDGVIFPHVRPFNPKTQKLLIYNGLSEN